jgi:hypothetical protein
MSSIAYRQKTIYPQSIKDRFVEPFFEHHWLASSSLMVSTIQVCAVRAAASIRSKPSGTYIGPVYRFRKDRNSLKIVSNASCASFSLCVFMAWCLYVLILSDTKVLDKIILFV